MSIRRRGDLFLSRKGFFLSVSPCLVFIFISSNFRLFFRNPRGFSMESRTTDSHSPDAESSHVPDSPQSEDNVAEKISDDNSEAERESLEQMLSRHRKEKSDLQSKEMEMKKAAARGSKAEQKAKKKQVEEEIVRLSSKLKATHSKELASLGCKSKQGPETSDIDSLVKAMAGVPFNNSQSGSAKPSKSLRRKEKRAQQEAAREQRIQEEQSNIISDRMIENEKLERKLEPLGLTINEIKPDGHCLYRAVEDQISLHSSSSRYTYLELRAMAASYMRDHVSEFLPFFLSEKLEATSEGSLTEKFEKYCTEVESTAAWGGQLELSALMHCLRKHIIIFSGSFPDVEMGKEYKVGIESSNPSIMLSYHKHAFGLGEHYNSVVPIAIQ